MAFGKGLDNEVALTSMDSPTDAVSATLLTNSRNKRHGTGHWGNRSLGQDPGHCIWSLASASLALVLLSQLPVCHEVGGFSYLTLPP